MTKNRIPFEIRLIWSPSRAFSHTHTHSACRVTARNCCCYCRHLSFDSISNSELQCAYEKGNKATPRMLWSKEQIHARECVARKLGRRSSGNAIYLHHFAKNVTRWNTHRFRKMCGELGHTNWGATMAVATQRTHTRWREREIVLRTYQLTSIVALLLRYDCCSIIIIIIQLNIYWINYRINIVQKRSMKMRAQPHSTLCHFRRITFFQTIKTYEFIMTTSTAKRTAFNRLQRRRQHRRRLFPNESNWNGRTIFIRTIFIECDPRMTCGTQMNYIQFIVYGRFYYVNHINRRLLAHVNTTFFVRFRWDENIIQFLNKCVHCTRRAQAFVLSIYQFSKWYSYDYWVYSGSSIANVWTNLYRFTHLSIWKWNKLRLKFSSEKTCCWWWPTPRMFMFMQDVSIREWRFLHTHQNGFTVHDSHMPQWIIGERYFVFLTFVDWTNSARHGVIRLAPKARHGPWSMFNVSIIEVYGIEIPK